ncbi:MAG: hypothetical protein NTW54_04535 [Bacteroidetes bacterium]|nr:hypothetical protein [Bacteroidota bacterium]
MHKPIRNALESIFAGERQLNVRAEMMNVFSSENPFFEKLKRLDDTVEHYKIKSISEILVDLLIMNSIAQSVDKEMFFESEEWQKIEESTLDRGSELLNMFLFLQECRDDDMTANLSTFLEDFLLVHEDEFQDEHRIYEDIITHQDLIESDEETILAISQNLSPDSDMKELFLPLMLYFYGVENKAKVDLKHFTHYQLAAYTALSGFTTIN